MGANEMKFSCPVCGFSCPHEHKVCPKCGEKVRGELIRIPELERPENARWLALLIDTEGALGYYSYTVRTDRINGYRYEYHYYVPYVGLNMREIEMGRTVDEGARLIGVVSVRFFDPKVKDWYRGFTATGGRALSAMTYMKPYLDKFRRMVELCQVLFKYRIYVPRERFEDAIKELFGKFLKAKEANEVLIRMTEEEFSSLIEKAKGVAEKKLR